MLKTEGLRPLFEVGMWKNMEKLHGAAARSTFASQNAQINTNQYKSPHAQTTFGSYDVTHFAPL